MKWHHRVIPSSLILVPCKELFPLVRTKSRHPSPSIIITLRVVVLALIDEAASHDDSALSKRDSFRG